MVYPEAVRKQGFARILCIRSCAVCAFPRSPKPNHPLFNPLAQEGGLRFVIPARLMRGGTFCSPFSVKTKSTTCSEPMSTINAPAGGTFDCQAGEQGAKLPFQPGVSFFSHSVVSISNNNS